MTAKRPIFAGKAGRMRCEHSESVFWGNDERDHFKHFSSVSGIVCHLSI